MLVVEREPQWLNEVEGGTCGQAKPTRSACVVWNLRGDQDEVEHRQKTNLGFPLWGAARKKA